MLGLIILIIFRGVFSSNTTIKSTIFRELILYIRSFRGIIGREFPLFNFMEISEILGLLI